MNKVQKKILLNIARLSINLYITEKKKLIIDERNYPDPDLWEDEGSFVTLTMGGNLRGCIGTIIPVRPLILDVAENAVNAAVNDYRFYPLTTAELSLINIEISVLTVPQALRFIGVKDLFSKVKRGIDGVIIRNGVFQSTFLPQVWKELPDKKEFFVHLCLKAGMNDNCYLNPNLEVYTYQVEAFSEKNFE